VDRFVSGVLDTLQSAPYFVSVSSDRMGFRLEGPTLRHVAGADIISEGTWMGVLQVPASGQPLVLMADRQTTGGYTKIATVISADIGLVGQLAPGDSVHFELCDEQTAFEALIARERPLLSIEAPAAMPNRGHEDPR
jgi:allophanate hydrolase subunit 2